MLLQNSSLVFKVRRNQPELVVPSSPTPHELKLLSDIDDQMGLRYQIQGAHIYGFHPLMKEKDPVQVIRQALAKTLVFYYPLAGRLRDAPNGKLMVDCTAEGVVFIEADADVTLEQLGNDLHPPFPCFDQLLHNVPGSDGITNCPLLLFQVTRLKCGGLIIATRTNHTMMDGVGIVQFFMALTEIARGETEPSILPVWCRELLCARNPPRVTCMHHEFEQQQQQLPHVDKKSTIIAPRQVSFFFGPEHIAAIRRTLPHQLAQSTSTSDVLTACLWRCYTAAILQYQNADDDDREVRLLNIANARFEPCRLSNPPLPVGYYGNAVVNPAAVTTVGKLCRRPLGYALELLKKAKNEATEEYVRSAVDLLATKGRPHFICTGSFMATDFTKLWPSLLDYGWGPPLCNGPANIGLGEFHAVVAYMPYTNSNGVKGRLALLCLPQQAIQRFQNELNGILNINDHKHPVILTSNI